MQGPWVGGPEHLDMDPGPSKVRPVVSGWGREPTAHSPARVESLSHHVASARAGGA